MRHRPATKFNRELVLALERARTRLAVAIASETKSTPPDRWRYYLDTSDRMRRFIKRLRAGSGELQEHPDWERALEALRRLPPQGKASQLCRILRDIVSEFQIADSGFPVE